MSEKSKIQWTDDTYNPWRGCTKVSDGCKNCYAEKLITTRLAHVHYEAATRENTKKASKQFHPTSGGANASGVPLWGSGSPRVRAVDLDEPLRWNKKPVVCDACGSACRMQTDWHLTPAGLQCGSEMKHRRRVFSLSLGDWLDDEVPIAWLAEFLDVVRRCENLDWLLVTKRPELWRERIDKAISYADEANAPLAEWLEAWTDCLDMPERGDIPQNIMVLTSVENQKAADDRIPALLNIPAARHGLSCEPLLGPVKLGLTKLQPPNRVGKNNALHQLHWVIVGGESGPGARSCDLDWIRSIQSKCEAASVPCFVKQLGANAGVECLNQSRQTYFSQIDYGKKGDVISEWPKDLQVREFYK